MKYPQSTLTNEALISLAEAMGLYQVSDVSLLRLIFDVSQDDALVLQRLISSSLAGGTPEAPDLPDALLRKLRAFLEWHSRFTAPKALKITGPKELIPRLSHWAYDQQENFLVVLMNGAQHLLDIVPVTKGLLNRTLIHPREIFAPALDRRASAIILAHNHPSGSLEPSQEDREVTDRLIAAGKILGIEVLDHLIFSETEYLSLREQGMLV